jgi:hypothetical protein
VDQFAWDAVHRRPGAVHSHRFEGTSAAFAAPALTLEIEKTYEAERDEWLVRVTLENVGAGHRIPTGTWSKHVAVGIWARIGDRWLLATAGERCRLVPGDAPAEALAAGDWRNPAGTVLGVRPKDPAVGLTPAVFWGAWPADSLVDDRLLPGVKRVVEARFEGAGEALVPTVEVHVVHRRGELGTGPGATPWNLEPYDPPPQTLWIRRVR